MKLRPIVLTAGAALIAVALAVPALAGQPTSPPGQAKAKVAKSPITLNGTVLKSTDADGDVVYTLADGGTTYTLKAGPKWFFGNNYPLEPYVGKDVALVGEIADGSTEVDVRSIDGTALRGDGKPPWAGGWKVVGERHPGWSQEKADRFEAMFGGCFPPGQCKDKPANPADAEKE